MATWYVGTGGSDLNSGSSDSNTADQSGAAGVVVTTTLTETGAFAAAAASGAINIQDAGNSLIRTYTKVNNDSITLDSAPTSGDGTYAWKIGGRRTSIKKTATTGTGNNAKVAAGDVVKVNAGTYTENAIAKALAILIQGVGAVIVDGTGGAGGSDIFTSTSGMIDNISVVNAVDIGFTNSGTSGQYSRCAASACATAGFVDNAPVVDYCSARACGLGFSPTGLTARFCEAGDNTSHGFAVGNAGTDLLGLLSYDNGGDGLRITGAASARYIEQCTLEGNTSDGLEMTVTGALGAGSVFLNNIISNNTGIGVNSSGGAQASALIAIDYNIFFGNGTARSNFPTGTNDKTTDPAYTAAASDDYSIKSTGSAYKAGYSPFKNPTLNTLNIGAVAGPGSGEAEGTMPATTDVRSGVQYGAGGTEFTGVLAGAGIPKMYGF